ncbi:YSIRK-type signal peptide-containing protein, partial [Streptococcus sp. S784/96/1]|uniref:YSIRK-type signal peptide-containing protein n=1 Tax=Streptococcus sp. S784/96/1 TaxID=2653499 RepID=UPI001386B23F
MYQKKKEEIMERQQRFSIRKFKTAVGSALLATMMLGAPMLQAVNVLAQDQATHQYQLNNTTNLVEAPKDMTELGQELKEKAGTSEG